MCDRFTLLHFLCALHASHIYVYAFPLRNITSPFEKLELSCVTISSVCRCRLTLTALRSVTIHICINRAENIYI